MKLCPYCQKEMEPAAVICPHCGRDWKSGVSRGSPDAPDDAKDSRPFVAKGLLLALVYLLLVAAALVGSSGPPREMPSLVALPILIHLTMPLSYVISFLFAWSTIHGASLAPMLVMLAISGFINAGLIAWGVARSTAD
ncbi:MAG TPA: hypothetical protein VL882_24670 [Vicinamibacterales bacterium]|nr:hypothetical protein [Vicinamibacterales bacterium]